MNSGVASVYVWGLGEKKKKVAFASALGIQENENETHCLKGEATTRTWEQKRRCELKGNLSEKSFT